MMPIGPLMIEHRLIERLIPLIAREAQRLEDNIAVAPQFAFVDAWVIDVTVDFIQTYADLCHHGKEEDILFAALKNKPLSPELNQVMAELTAEHAQGRQLTARLAQAKLHYSRGVETAVHDIIAALKDLAAFYPPHILKEDQHFFLPCMEYFSPTEKSALLGQMWEFDRRLIHSRYTRLLDQLEHSEPCSR